MKDLFAQAAENALYVLSFFLIIAGLFVCAVIAEKVINKKKGVKDRTSVARRTAFVGLFSALSAVLMLLEIPMPFAPTFYKLDMSELPILIAAYAFGPSAGILIEFLKIVLNLFLKGGTSTAFVGELANFTVGASFILPTSVIYYAKKTKKMATVSCIVGTICITLFGTIFNAVYLLPAFAKLYGIPLEVIYAMGAEVNPFAGDNVVSFVIACVAPLNLIKGLLNSALALLVYKKISPIIKGAGLSADLVKKQV